VQKRRDRIIVFRLTEDEHEDLKSASASHGARSVSDFARSELLQAVERDRSEVLQRLAELQAWMKRVEQLLEAYLTAGRKKGARG
jgi:uncharacterized protein (DUF1778 family)